MNERYTFHQAVRNWDEYTLRVKLRQLCDGDWRAPDAARQGWESPQQLAELFSAPEMEEMMLREFDRGHYKKCQLYFMAACILIHCGHVTRCGGCYWLSDCLGVETPPARPTGVGAPGAGQQLATSN